MLSVGVLSYFQLFTKAIDQQLNKFLIIDLELLPLVENLFNQNLELNSWTVFRVNELLDDLVEFVGIFI